MKLEHLLYLFIIIILAIFMGYYVKDIGLLSVKEGARTYPMPRLHPLKQKYGSFQGDSQSNVISMNKIIDEFIARYFDQNGVPYLNTIDDVQSYIVGPGTTGPYNYGAISDQMKSELTDIGYYLIEMVLPALPTVENRKPNQELPLLKLSGMPGFEMEVANIPKCMVYKGSSDTNLRFIYNNPQSSLLSKFEQGFDSIFDTNDYNQSSTTTSSSSGSEGSDTGGTTSDKCAPNRVDCPSDCCGITCPQQCFQNALGTAAPASSSSTDSSSGSADGSGSTTNTGNPYHSTINAAQIFNNMTSSLTHTNNSETICPSQTIGYDITQIPLTKDTIQNTILKNKIQKDVLEYFTSYQKSTTQFEPTEKLKNMIEFYSTQYSPMDQFHYELLRELIYYVLQVIIPGMPTPALPYLYIEWRSFLKYQ